MTTATMGLPRKPSARQRGQEVRYDYYTIDVPSDAFVSEADAGHCAINEARDRARIYCMPCDWSATLLSKDGWTMRFRVRRRRNAPRSRE